MTAIRLATAVVLLFISGSLWLISPAGAAEALSVSSPDGQLTLSFAIKSNPAPYTPGSRAYYRVSHKGVEILADSPLGLAFVDAASLEADLEIAKSERRSHDATWENRFGAKRVVPDRYNELTVTLLERRNPPRRVDMVFRAYNEGVALRYVLPKQTALRTFAISSENTSFCFAHEASAFALNMGKFNTHNEGEYRRMPLSEIKPNSIVNLPLLVEMPGGPWVAILEADLNDYAGMYLGGVPGVPRALRCKLSPAPGRNPGHSVVGSTPKSTPWRVVMVGPTAGSLIEANYLPLNLSPPCALADASWIEPGKAAWDWWSGSFAKDVPFKPGMNTATMKHYIDFAAAAKLEYMLVDAGWSPSGKGEDDEDVLNYRPEVNVPDIVDYGKQKGVKTLLWVHWLPLSTKMDAAFAQYEKWGVAGVKVDFMNRDDQQMVNFYDRCVRKAAEHHLVVDFHGAYKGTGRRRTYPNLLTREGVMGMEYCKWSDRVTPEYDVTIPFTRMLCGPMDFTPGAFINTVKGQFKAREIEPMSLGTRAHQLAMYVVYEAPLVMVSDYPESYKGQPEFEFIEKVPTVWDDTKVLSGEPGKFIAMARRSGDRWFVGAMTNWDARDVPIPLDFLGKGAFDAKIFADAPDADKVATHVAISEKPLKASDTFSLHLAPGGGAAVILTPER